MKARMLRQQRIAQTLIKFQNDGFHSAIVTGGAVRNTLLRDDYVQHPSYAHGGTDEDVQIVLHYPPDSEEPVRRGDVMNIIEDIIKPNPVSGQLPQDYFNVHRLNNTQLFNYVHNEVIDTRKDGVEYNIVLTTIEPTEYLKRETVIGINKAYYDGNKFSYMPLCMSGYMDKEIYVCRDDLTADRIDMIKKVVLPGLQIKFPSYAVRYHQTLYDNGVI